MVLSMSTHNIIDSRTQRNLQSLDLSRGLARGRFQDVDFLVKMRPQNLIETSVFVNQMWEPHIAELIASYLTAPGNIVIDVGANIGASSIPLARKFPDTEFYLFEPHPDIFSDLSENVMLNRCRNVNISQNAVSNVNGKVPFFAQQNNNSNMGLSSLKMNSDLGDFAVIDVSSIRIDDYFGCEFRDIAIIKIDTQGAELDVLNSASNIIYRHRPIIIFEFESEYFEQTAEVDLVKSALLLFFKERSYKLYCIQREVRFLPVCTLEGYFNGDVLAVPC